MLYSTLVPCSFQLQMEAILFQCNFHEHFDQDDKCIIWDAPNT